MGNPYILTGTCKDNNNAVVPGATVRIFDTATNTFWASGTSDGAGNFSIPMPVQGPLYAVAYHPGSPDIVGTSVNTLMATAVNSSGLAVFVGDSLTAGTGAPAGSDYPTVMTYPAGTWTHSNLGVPGSGFPGLGSTPDTLFAPGGIIVVWGGTNNIAGGSTDGPGAYSMLVTYCNARKAVGWRVIVLTMLPRSDTGTVSLAPNFEKDRAIFNELVLTNWATFCDGVVDVSGDSRIGYDGAETDTTYFAGDLVHLNATGYLIIASLVNPVFASNSLPALAPINTAAPVISGPKTTYALLTTTPGTWQNNLPLKSKLNSWLNGGNQVSNANAVTYIPNIGDVGATLQFQEIYTNTAGSRTAVSNSWGPITGIPAGNVLDAGSLGVGGVLSNGGNTFSITGASYVAARTTIGKSTGKWYAEFQIIVGQSGAGNVIEIGITNGATTPLSSFLGNLTESVGVFDAATMFTSAGFTTVNAWASPDGLNMKTAAIYMVAFDATAKKVWIGKNGAWSAAGNPGAGTNPMSTWTGAFTIYPAVSTNNTATQILYLQTANVYAPPTGFSVLA